MHEAESLPATQLDLDGLLATMESMQRRLDAVEASLQQSELLTASLAHEYRNILTPVAAYAQLALSERADEQLVRKALKLAVEGAQRGALMADALMGCSEEPLSQGKASFRQTVQEVQATLDTRLSRMEIVVHDPGDAELPIQPVALKQILLNLFLNGLQAMGRTGGSLGVGASELRSGGWRIWCRDQGPGVSSAMRERLFEPYACEAAGGRRGHGLGLYICHRLMREAGGHLLLEVSDGPGATFHLCFPPGSSAQS